MQGAWGAQPPRMQGGAGGRSPPAHLSARVVASVGLIGLPNYFETASSKVASEPCSAKGHDSNGDTIDNQTKGTAWNQLWRSRHADTYCWRHVLPTNLPT